MNRPTLPRNGLPRALVLTFSACVLLVLMLSGPIGHGQSAQLAGARDAKLRDEEVRAQMIVISRQLGVNCLTCHDNANFASDKKKEFKVSREHMKLVQVLIDAGMNGRGANPKADCYLCHRGQLKPDFKEPHDPLTMGKMKTESASSEAH
ncbi:MAG: photosynthetic reaction center cytochrome c subunit [Bdellovibrionaceae bacterium]|nr:photosynthetic reaction center cytochrome c subunit [Pseudobdellovibrionaceae bacterium]